MSGNIYRYFVKLAYNGKHFHGWQRQENAVTVQETLEEAFSVLLRRKTELTGCGRTDTGVHADMYFAHFESPGEIEDTKQLVYRLNSFLGADIAIESVFPVNCDLHSRFSASERSYRYRIATHKNPFTQDFAYYFYAELDIENMNKACEILKEYTDFTSFSKLHGNQKTNLCNIFHAEWTTREDEIIFHIRADRFLRNMVRAIVGTMLEIGTGKMNLEKFRAVIEAKNRSRAGFSAPAHGLSLVRVEYAGLEEGFKTENPAY